MTSANHIPIIAVFGSTDAKHRKIAELIGEELATRRCIALTGRGPNRANAVKDWVIDGTDRKSGCWINVENDTRAGAAWKVEADKPRKGVCVVRSYIGHKRNYLEACLCDAAIAIEGGSGTISEATFCMSLHKPVVFVGQDWINKSQTEGWEQLVTGCEEAMGRSQGVASPFDPIFPKVANDLRGLGRLLLAWLPASEAHVDLIVRYAIDLCSLSFKEGVTGAFPIVASLPAGYFEAARDYEEWLRKTRTILAGQI